MTITLTANKQSVLAEVAQTTSYTGAKMVGDDDAYDRIYTTDEDKSQLQRFWDEAKSEVCASLMYILSASSDTDTAFSVTLDVSSRHDAALVPSMQKSLISHLVLSIVSKWFAFSNKSEADAYAKAAAAAIEDVHKKALMKKRPVLPS